VDLPAAKAIILKAGLDAVTEGGDRVIDRAVRMLCAPLVKWLIDQGCDVASLDRSGDTPLHQALYWMDLDVVKVLLAAGAPLETPGAFGDTPLAYVFANCHSDPTPYIRVMLEHGAVVTARVLELGYEWDPQAFAALLDEFHVEHGPPPPPKPPEPERAMPPPVGRIEVADGSWKKQFDALWDLLVPSRGAAATLQGEVIRLAGKLTREAYDNGNINWNPTIRKGWRFVATTLAGDDVLSAADKTSVTNAVDTIVRDHRWPDVSGDGSPCYIVQELTVRWVLAHPEPIAFDGGDPHY